KPRISAVYRRHVQPLWRRPCYRANRTSTDYSAIFRAATLEACRVAGVCMNIPLSQPDITEVEIEAVVAVLRSSRLSIGPKQEEFEQLLAAYVGVPHAIAVSSGTAGLHLCIRALGIGKGDDVIVPSF